MARHPRRVLLPWHQQAAATLALDRPLIPKEPVKLADRFGEVAGATAATCAAFCCCCPCGLNLVVAAAVKLPTSFSQLCH